ncbi:MAG: sugar phosphate isomerase/epimerase [Gemmiger sp.]|nr:sugar phosphate isomerase/epimerase [Gemmiger sp.]
MKFGVFSVSMPEYDLEETVVLLKELGYDGVEWRVQDMPAQKPADIPFDRRYWVWNKSTIDLPRVVELAPVVKALCQKHGLEIFGLTSYLHPAQYTLVEPVLQAAQIMGAKMVRVFPPEHPDNSGKTQPELWRETKSQIKILEGMAKQYGVKIVFEIHMDNLMASPSAAFSLIDGCDPDAIGLIFDPGNMVNEGYEDYQKSFELLGRYIAHIHVKNGILAPDGRDELGAAKWVRKWTPLKEGMADLRHFFNVLKANHYDGTVSVEDFSNEQTTRDKLAGNLAYMKTLAQ